MQGTRCRIQDARCGIQDSGFKMQDHLGQTAGYNADILTDTG